MRNNVDLCNFLLNVLLLWFQQFFVSSQWVKRLDCRGWGCLFGEFVLNMGATSREWRLESRRRMTSRWTENVPEGTLQTALESIEISSTDATTLFTKWSALELLYSFFCICVHVQRLLSKQIPASNDRWWLDRFQSRVKRVEATSAIINSVQF
jgi:hypothetical protein